MASESPQVPLRALGFSVMALAIPMMGVTIAPDWLSEEQGLLLWLTALVPPFLLTYYRGWKGASIGLAAGMAALTLTNLVLLLTGVEVRNPIFPLWITSTYIVVCVGAGVLAELLRRERKAAEEMALTDALTELPNRRHATIFLDAAFAAATRGQPVSVVLFDLDHFKNVNDKFGHRSGDAVLKRMGVILRVATRRMDLSARWGGEEFISILARCKADGAVSFAQRVQRELRDEVFPWGTVTVSAGVAEFEPGMGSPELIIAAADQALYVAKAEGRNRCVVAGSGVTTTVETGSAWDPSLQRGTLRLEDGPRGLRLVPDSESWPLEDGAKRDEGHAPPGGSESVLVVEDNDAARAAIVRILERLGYNVAEARDGQSALAHVRSGKAFELVITGLLMPGMSGFTLANLIQREFGPQRFLYMSGEVQGEMSWKGAPGSRVAFLEKPMTEIELAAGVRELLDLAVEEGVTR